jgi:putative ABC transport system ATP-binding protein
MENTYMLPIVKVKNLAMTYDTGGTKVSALRGIDLTINRGEFVAVIGPSGCGKSTLLNLLAGLDRPTSGEIWIGDERINGLSESKLALLRRKKIGYVFQFFNLIPSISVIENIELPLKLVRRSHRETENRAEKLLQELGIDSKRDTSPALLSGGQQQRVALARAMANHPDIVLADEPTGNLDSVAAHEVLQLLHAARGKGQTILVVTHDSRVAQAADRVITMKDGQIVDKSEEENPV